MILSLRESSVGWYIDKSMSRDPRYMGYWSVTHTANDLGPKRYDRGGWRRFKIQNFIQMKYDVDQSMVERFESKDTPQAIDKDRLYVRKRRS